MVMGSGVRQYDCVVNLTDLAAWKERILMKIFNRPLQHLQETLIVERHWISYMKWSLSLAFILHLSLTATLAWAGTVQDVGSLLEDPGAYQSQVVRVTGTVYNHRIRRGMNNCFQLFTIEDNAGSIEAIYQANCQGAGNVVRDRDVVTVEARVELTASNSGMLKVQSIVSKVAPSAQ